MPYVLEQCDRVWMKPNSVTGFKLPAPPSSYFPGRVFGCFFQDDFGILVHHVIGADQITIESDYPHQDSTWPDTSSIAAKALKALSEEDVHKITRLNAIKLFQLPAQLTSL